MGTKPLGEGQRRGDVRDVLGVKEPSLRMIVRDAVFYAAKLHDLVVSHQLSDCS